MSHLLYVVSLWFLGVIAYLETGALLAKLFLWLAQMVVDDPHHPARFLWPLSSQVGSFRSTDAAEVLTGESETGGHPPMTQQGYTSCLMVLWPVRLLLVLASYLGIAAAILMVAGWFLLLDLNLGRQWRGNYFAAALEKITS